MKRLKSGEKGHARAQRAEYWSYFAIIFVFSLPWALFSWLASLARLHRDAAEKGVISRARSQARIITPMIFSA